MHTSVPHSEATRSPYHFAAIVVGGGHAGIEAALALARTGHRTLLLTPNLEAIGRMSCNPAIGGLAKGHIAVEIDVLGGEMGKASDACGIHFRMLNTSKGEAVWAPRAQMDKAEYSLYMKHVLEKQDKLCLMQDMAKEILVENNGVTGIVTERNQTYYADAIILTTGTFMKGLIHIGTHQAEAGRLGEHASNFLSDSLRELGFEIGRLKTGTPARINSHSIDYSQCEKQDYDNFSFCFSHTTKTPPNSCIDCYITYTSPKTHEIIHANLDKAPLYSGQIQGIGPRYCPSIEDKVVRFSDKERHQLFLEPEGKYTAEVYINGLSTSLPEPVQWEMIRSIKGLEHAEIMRMGYAVEYDFCNPIQLKPTLETKQIQGLYFAGQINGTSGYEEAAAQGLIAGINASLSMHGKSPLILNRTESYIGVLIDDLITKGVEEPYRMFTSRAEYRLCLRWDNADQRLMQYGNQVGLITDTVFESHHTKWERIRQGSDWVEEKRIGANTIPAEVSTMIKPGNTVADVIRKPQLEPNLWHLWMDDSWKEDLEILRQIGIEAKYKYYIKRQEEAIARFHKLETLRIPNEINYDGIQGLLTEAREKLKRVRPVSVGQAARISGVNPSDISVLLVYLRHAK